MPTKPEVGKYRPPLACGQSESWEGGLESEGIDRMKALLRRERDAVDSERRSVQRQMKKARKEGLKRG